MKTATDIKIGTPVSFDSDHGPQCGIVAGFKADIGNGRRVAVIDVPGAQDSEPWNMPVEQLQRATATA